MLTRVPASGGGGARVLPPLRRVVSAAMQGEHTGRRASWSQEVPPRRYKGVAQFGRCNTDIHGHTVNCLWTADLHNPQTNRAQTIGFFSSGEDAARAYDCAAVKLLGPGTKRNFPGEQISVYKYVPQTQRQQCIGYYASEEDAARAYDCVDAKLLSQGTKRNFPGEQISVYKFNPQTQRQQCIGDYASEEDAARAYEDTAVETQADWPCPSATS
jgi:hypothetical protein